MGVFLFFTNSLPNLYSLLSFITSSTSCPHSGLQSCGDSRPIPDLCTQTSRSFNSGPGYNILVRGTGCGCIFSRVRTFRSRGDPQRCEKTPTAWAGRCVQEALGALGPWSWGGRSRQQPGEGLVSRPQPLGWGGGRGHEPRRSSPPRRRLGRATRSGCRGN